MKYVKCVSCGKKVSVSAASCPKCGGTSFKKKKNGCLKVILAALSVILVIAIIQTAIIESNMTDEERQARAEQREADAVEAARSVLNRTLDLTSEQENRMIEVFSSVGIGVITVVDQGGHAVSESLGLMQNVGADYNDDEWDDFIRKHTMYSLQDAEIRDFSNERIVIWIRDEDKTIVHMFFNGRLIMEYGEIVSDVTNYYVTREIRRELEVATQLIIRDLMTRPDTVQWVNRNRWSYRIDENKNITIIGRVSSENALGIRLENNFQIIWSEWQNPISLIIGDQVFIQ